MDVLIEVWESAPIGNRQIASRRAVAEQLAQRREDIEAALDQVVALANAAMEKPSPRSLAVSGLEVKFGLKLSAEAGVIVSRASAEASLEITVKVERRPSD